MTALRTPAGRRAPGWIDHVFGFLTALAGTAAAGAAVVLAANLAEGILGGAGLALSLAWTVGIVAMHAPVTGWPLALAGGALWHLARRAGWGGWAVAAGIGAALAAAGSAGLELPPVDRAIRVAIGAGVGWGYWKVVDWRTANIG